MITDEYLAGLFDGEGYVGINSWHKGESYGLRCEITNSDVQLLEKIQEKYGGNVLVQGYPQGNRRVCYKINWNARKAKNILEIMYPHLIVKKSQTRLALEFTLNDKRHTRTKWMIEKQKQIFEEIKLIKSEISIIPEKYKNIAIHEHQEMLRKKRLTLLLKKENPNLTMKELGDLVGVSSTMICNYLEKI